MLLIKGGMKIMNKNVEVINKYLWAVRFNYLDYIEEISIKADPTIPIEEEPGRIADGGLLILNKDHKGYLVSKDIFIKLMKKSDKQIMREVKNADQINGKNDFQVIYSAMLQVEIERRKKLKGR